MHHQRHLAHHRVHAVAERHHQRAGDAFLTRHELQITHIGQEARELGHRAAELDARSGGAEAHAPLRGICARDAEGALGHIELHRHLGRVVTSRRRLEQIGVIERTQWESQRRCLIASHHQCVGQSQVERGRWCGSGKAQDRLIFGQRGGHAGGPIDGGTHPIAALAHAHFAATRRLHPAGAQIARHPHPAVGASRRGDERLAIGADRHPGALRQGTHRRPLPIGIIGIGVEDLPAGGRGRPALAAGISAH